MSNFLAIATVTAALSQTLRAAVETDVPGASVTTLRPDAAGGGIPATRVNLYLYQVTPNTAWRNADLPTRNSDGQLTQRAQVAIDLSGRGYAVMNVSWSGPTIGELPSDLVEHFLQSMAHEARFNMHVRVLAGVNDHHKAECTMKALGRALCAATRLDERRAGSTPSTKEAIG